MLVRIAALAALAAGAPWAVAAEPLGLREVLRYVEAASPELAAAGQLRAGAEAETLTARAYPNPDLDLGAGPWRSRIGGATGTAGSVGISQLIELPSVRGARTEASAAGLSAASAHVDSVRLAVGYQARAAFFEMLRRQEEERLAAESVRLLADIRGKVQTRVEVGEAPRFELVRAESEALAAQNAAAAAALRVDEARAVLRRLGGDALPSVFVARGTLPPLPEAPPLATLVPQVLAAHPQLRVASAEAERARSRLQLERSLRNPQPTLRAIGSSDPESRQAMVGISIPLPLWNRREGPIAQAQASIGYATAQVEAQRAQLLRELDSAYARLGVSQRQISTFENGLLRTAEAGLFAAEEAYRAGERSFLEVLDAQRTLRSVRADYNQARFDRNAAWMDIERLTARDPFRAAD
ncbi:MAG: TolC family protein [Proteobacteria bacterium]|nr:TolC family protein [Pseudomonadota bacterium]